jgi:uncharacterized repeat protein (TIGR02543 family)
MKNMKNTRNSLAFNLKSFRNGTFLSFATLLLVTILFFSPLLSVVRGNDEYNIIYTMNMGGTNHPDNPTKYSTSANSISIHDANDPRYEFMGWSVIYRANYTQVVMPQRHYSIPAGTYGDIELAAIFDTSPLGYPITYILNGGQNHPSNDRNRYFGAKDYYPIVIPDPYRVGYNFLGWTVEYSNGAPDVTVPQHDFKIEYGTTGAITLTAHWSDPVIYNINYVLNGGTISGPFTYTVLQLPLNINVPSRADYNFLRWTAVCANTSYVELSSSVIPAGTAGDITLTAQWTVAGGIAYTIEHYDAVSGRVLATDSLFGTLGSLVTANVKAIPGYVFDASDSRNVLSGTVSSGGSLVLKVYYTPNADVGSWYTLTYNGNGNTGGSAPVDNSSPYYEGSRVTVLGQGNMVKAGYVFLGWASSSSASSATFTAGSTFTINNNMVLYAVWTDGTYTVTYQPGVHGTFAAQTTTGLHYGDQTPIAPTVTGDAGWNFTGWSPIPTATVTSNATYVAQWTQITTSTSPSTSAPSTSAPSTSTSTSTSPPSPSTSTAPPEHVTGVSDNEPKWAIVNLLVSVIGVILALVTVLFVLLLKRKPDKQNTVKNQQMYRQRSFLWLAATVALAVIGIVAFLVTQDLSLPFGWIVDKWTVVNIVILVVECITIWLCLKTANTGMNNTKVARYFNWVTRSIPLHTE